MMMIERAYVYLTIGLCLLGYSCDWPICFKIAAGLNLGAATALFIFCSKDYDYL